MKKSFVLLLIAFVLAFTACQSSSSASESSSDASESLSDSSESFGTSSESGGSSQTFTISTDKYIANKNSGKLHYYTCVSLPAEHNRVYFSSEAEANAAGYTDNHKECMGK